MLMHQNRSSRAILLGIGLSVMLASCAHLPQGDHQQPKNNVRRSHPAVTMQSQTQQLANFDSVSVTSDRQINLQIIANAQTQDIRLLGNPNDVAKVTAKVKDGVLEVVASKKFDLHEPVLVVVRTKQLQQLKFYGEGSLTAIDINSPSLDLDIDNYGDVNLSGPRVGLRRVKLAGSGTIAITGVKTTDLKIMARGDNDITLRGHAVLRKLYYRGDGNLNILWVNTPDLVIRAGGDGNIKLAGRADQLDVILNDNVVLNARHLVTRRTFAKTYNRSVAELHTTEAQHVLASDASDIYTYRNPDYQADYMGFDGAALNMARITG